MNDAVSKELRILAHKMKGTTITDLFRLDSNRAKDFSIQADDLLFDYSKHLINRSILEKLKSLGDAAGLDERITDMRSGKPINFTENRQVLHIALRGGCLDFSGKEKIDADVDRLFQRMGAFAEQIRTKDFLGSTGKSINTIVNIGIGGSDLGVDMVCRALTFYADPTIDIHFISNIDPAGLNRLLTIIDPERTLFIICSKSFTTVETLSNARAARDFMHKKLGDLFDPAKHFCAISAAPDKADQFGISRENIFPMWDWVGGRYSVCATGLAAMIAIGSEQFSQFIEGFTDADDMFFNAPVEANPSKLMGFLGVWYNNFLDAQTHAVIPYTALLNRFPDYLRQTDMESNGKRVNNSGEVISYQTGPVIWGEPGTNAQHSFFQLLHQGTKLIPCDFIGYVTPSSDTDRMHETLMANFFAQQEVLAFGKSDEQLREENEPETLIPFKVMPGNRPVTGMLFDQLTPRSLGKLIGLYEHKVFVQGVIWQINPFDQWGVELGKTRAVQIAGEMNSGQVHEDAHDPSTAAQIKRYIRVRNT